MRGISSSIVFTSVGIIALVLTACASPVPTPSPTPMPNPLPMVSPSPTVAPTATPTPTLAPTTMPTVAPTPTLALVAVKSHQKPEDSLFDMLLKPFVNEAQRRRGERVKKDPEYARRVDKELNEGRVNFLLFGYGETHEPPATEIAIIGSDTIVSYDTRTRQVDLISLTHDIRAPEIEQELRLRASRVPVQKIDQAYHVGGFKLMRKVLENATGLSMDFQVTFKDTVIQDMVDQVFEGVEVDVPAEFKVHPFYLNGKKYSQGYFPKGKQKLNGTQVIQFIKTVPIAEGYYGRSLEHNARKHLVFQALREALNKHSTDRGFWLRSSAFVTGELVTGAIVYDFDPLSLMVNNIGSIGPDLGKYVVGRKGGGIGLPKIDKTKYIVDLAHGDGGVQWVNPDTQDPFMKRDIQNGVYAVFHDTEVPFNGDPYATDLATHYWGSVRSLVKRSLMPTEPLRIRFTEEP